MAEVIFIKRGEFMANSFLSISGANQLIDHLNDALDTLNLDSFSVQNGVVLFFSIAAFLLLIGFVFRILFSAHCTPNRVISGTLEILFLYIFTVFIYAVNPWHLSKYLSPLPFAYFRQDLLILSSVGSDSFSALSADILSLIILSFIVHLTYYLLPTGKHFFRWIFWRFTSLLLIIFLSLTVNYAISTFIPEGIASYAPIVVISILAATLILSLFNPLLCVIFTVANPVFGILYTFFFSNAIGKQLTKAVFTSILILFIFYIADYTGLAVISIGGNNIWGYIPIFLSMLGVWFIFDNKF